MILLRKKKKFEATFKFGIMLLTFFKYTLTTAVKLTLFPDKVIHSGVFYFIFIFKKMWLRLNLCKIYLKKNPCKECETVVLKTFLKLQLF